MGKDLERPYLAQLNNLFRGEYGELLFTRTPLVSGLDERAERLAVLALYPDRVIRYKPFSIGFMPQTAAEYEILELRHFPRNIALREARTAARHGLQSPPEGLKSWSWRTAARETKPLNLPAILVTWEHARNKPMATILWYHGATQGQWALAILKQVIRTKKQSSR